MSYEIQDLIKVLEAIKKTEIESLTEEEVNSRFLDHAIFGMNFIINCIKDYDMDKESLLDTYDITSICEGYDGHNDIYTYYTKKEWNEED